MKKGTTHDVCPCLFHSSNCAEREQQQKIMQNWNEKKSCTTSYNAETNVENASLPTWNGKQKNYSNPKQRQVHFFVFFLYSSKKEKSTSRLQIESECCFHTIRCFTKTLANSSLSLLSVWRCSLHFIERISHSEKKNIRILLLLLNVQRARGIV